MTTKRTAPSGVARAQTMRAAVRGPSPQQAHPMHPATPKRQPNQPTAKRGKMID